MALTDPVLFYHYYFGPAFPACYRLVGPGAKPGAREVFLQSGANQMHAITLQTVRGDAAHVLQNQNGGLGNMLKFCFIVAVMGVFFFNFLF